MVTFKMQRSVSLTLASELQRPLQKLNTSFKHFGLLADAGVYLNKDLLSCDQD